jgi:hypothetical protein
MLCGGSLVGLIVMVDRAMVVFVFMGHGHVLPLGTVVLVVDHVGVPMRVQQRVVVMRRQADHLLT